MIFFSPTLFYTILDGTSSPDTAMGAAYCITPYSTIDGQGDRVNDSSSVAVLSCSHNQFVDGTCMFMTPVTAPAMQRKKCDDRTILKCSNATSVVLVN